LKKRLKWAAIGTALAALVLPGAAGAHVTVQPSEAPAKGFVVENVRVPSEEANASTTKVAVQFPPGFAEVSYEPVPGWRVTVKKTKLAQPITTDEGDKLTEQVSEIIWSGGKIAPGQFQDFPVSLQMPDKPGTTLTFKAVQTYDNGKVVRWIGPPNAQEPAPQVKVTAASGDSASATPASSTKSDDDSDTLVIVALIVGALGLLLGGAAFLSRRRAA
jgi:periplasmic copper chaperone A